jgi:hypothetical protein
MRSLRTGIRREEGHLEHQDENRGSFRSLIIDNLTQSDKINYCMKF